MTTAAQASAGEWEHIDGLFGSTGCAARLSGKEVDTMLMLSGTGQLILVAGRRDWHSSGPEQVSLRIDKFSLTPLRASAFNNLLLLPISDKGVLQRLRKAKELYWSLPSGTYHATVAGIGNALDWVRQCERRRQ